MALRLGRLAIQMVILAVALPVLGAAAFIGYTTYLDRTNGTLVSSGIVRRYLLFVPATYDASRPTALVISLHGAAAWPAEQMHLTHWNDVAAEHGFIVAYPAARGRIWHVQHPGSDPSDDVQFIRDLIDTLGRRYRIDPDRIYVNGFSLGGAMAFVLACRLSDRVAAVGTVSAAETLPWSWCTDRRPIPFINFHGTADLVPYDGGRSPDPMNRVTFPAVRQWTAAWAERNRCRNAADSAAASDIIATAYHDCADSAPVVLYSVQGGGHAWPGGKPLPQWFFGRTATSLDATRVMWTFFAGHPRRPN